tara:strand:+ start:17925 stop:18914 length:990 start_codon:yes stop_codon:yes gene_type:complete
MLLIVYGTRPEYIKVKPILDNLTIPYKVLFTGQHKNIVPVNDGIVLSIIDGDNRLDSIVQSTLNNDSIFNDITHVMVQGDTTSAFAVALAAFHRNIPVIHLEAGLRTYERNPYPEEFNRQTISKIAKYHLCPTETNKLSLINERTLGKFYVVGNTVIDNIVSYRDSIEYNNEVLITMHRRENHNKLPIYFSILEELANENKHLTFTIPLHPNPNVTKHSNIFSTVNVIEPLNHSDMIDKLSKCRFLISDSGGVQEEASFLNKKVIVCRESTERIETIGVTSFLCKTPDDLRSMFYNTNDNFIPIEHDCPYGNGNSGEIIVNILSDITNI